MQDLLKPDRFDWVVEPLVNEPSLIQRSWFGCLAYYLYGKLVLVTSAGEEPWKGLLIPTEKPSHESLIRELPSLRVHPVLGKWLYLSASADEFEEFAGKTVSLIRFQDPRIGVETFPKGKPPSPRRKKRSSSRAEG